MSGLPQLYVSRACRFALVIMLGLDLAAAGTQLPAGYARIMVPRIQMTASEAALRLTCNVGPGVYACTTFEVNRLTCACRKTELDWRLDVGIEIRPVIVLSSRLYLDHERLHVALIAAWLRQYVVDVSGKAFDTEINCVRGAGAMVRGFDERLQEMKANSNLALDGRRTPGRRAPAPHSRGR